MLTRSKDVLGALLLVFLLPVWMALGLGAVIVMVTRHLYWWARGNTTATSRPSEFATPQPADDWTPTASAARARAPLAAVLLPSPAVAGVAAANPAGSPRPRARGIA
jgi:hypothetical protein